MHSRTLYSLFCLLPCTGLGLLSPATADTLTVCSSGCDYSDIESAIDAASDGDVIEIAAGTFGGHSGDEVGTLGKAITIRGAVDSAGEPLTSVSCRLYISGGETSSTVFENLIVKYQWHVTASNPTIRNCVFDDVQLGFPGPRDETMVSALHVVGGSGHTLIEHCSFTNNGFGSADLGGSPYGTYQSASGLQISGDCTVSDCLFDRNAGGNYGCAMSCKAGDITVENCTFTNNGNSNWSYGGALGILNSSQPDSFTVTDCTFIGNSCSKGGGAIYSEEGGTARNCLFQDNRVTDAFRGGAILGFGAMDSTFCGNYSNHFETLGFRMVDHGVSNPSNCYANSCDDDCDGDGVLDPCGSGLGNTLLVPAMYPTIEAAVAAACYLDVIEIAAGTYAPAETLNTRGLGLTLRGAVDASGRPATIIDGQGERRVIECIGEKYAVGPETVLENLMIVRGSDPSSSSAFVTDAAGLFSNESIVVLDNCVFQGNEDRAIYAKKSTLTVSNCSFESNAGGGVYLECGENLFYGCDFADNAAPQGAGVFYTRWYWEREFNGEFVTEWLTSCDDPGLTTFEACTFASNGPCEEGGGVFIEGADHDWGDHPSNPIFRNCVFNSGNAQVGGAMVIENASPQLEDCVFAENEAMQSGGAVLIRGEGLPILSQCNFHHNHAVRDGGAIMVEAMPELIEELMVFTDCRFTSNTARRGGALANHRQVLGFNSLSLEDCTIDDNIAEEGGGVFSGAFTGTQLMDSRVRNNHATGGGLGGGLHGALLHAGSHTVQNTEFCGNQPEHIMGGWADNGGNTFLFMCIETGPADFNHDGRVDGADMGLLIARWGPCLDEPCAEDINGDGNVNGGDLGILIASWSQ